MEVFTEQDIVEEVTKARKLAIQKCEGWVRDSDVL